MGKRRIKPVELEIGSVLPWDAYDEHGRLLLRKGQTVNTGNQIERLIERGLFAEIDPDRPVEQLLPDDAPSAVQPILDVRRRLQLLCSPHGSKIDFTQEIRALRALIAQACRLNKDVAFATALLVKEGRYSIRHATDVAVACHLAGSAMGLNERDLSCTVAAALTMNMSILKLQDDLQAQKEPLSDAQRKRIHQHPEESARMLRERGVTDELWIEAVLCHHEAIDGSGYCHGKKGDEIPLLAQLVLMGDIYCARISSRTYRRALHPNAALRALFLEQGKQLREGLAAHFIKTIGVFPAGTPVRLENGEIAVVTQRGESANTPHVSSIIGPRGMPFAAPIKRDTGRPTYGVREVVEWKDVGAAPSMQTLWGEIAASYRA